MIHAYLQKGVLGQALKKNIYSYQTINPRIFTEDVHRTIDDRPYGGGDGMVMLAEPLQKSIESIENYNSAKKIILSPQGKKIDQKWICENYNFNNWIFICGRYSGIDQRFINSFSFEEVSVGDYVVSGGELPALLVVDAILRQVPGVLGHHESAQKDSFAEGVLEGPSFTRPEVYNQQSVPDILRSGDHAKILNWKKDIALITTFYKRKDIFENLNLSHQVVEEALQRITDHDLTVCGLPNRKTILAK